MGGVVKGVLGSITPSNNFVAGHPVDRFQDFQDNIPNLQAMQYRNFADEYGLSDQLRAQAQGAGPNLATQQLKDATNRNIAQNTSLIASQRGMNPGLAVRLASQNAANVNQQAAGQAAQLRAQQQLASQNQLSGLYSNIGQQGLQNHQILQQALAAQNGQQMQGTGINAGIAAQNTAGQQALLGGMLGSGAALLAAHKGGEVPHYAAGGDVSSSFANQLFSQYGVPMYGAGAMPEVAIPHHPDTYRSPFGDLGPGMQMDSVAANAAPGATESLLAGAMLAATGGHVPGRATVKGDSLKNDTVPAMLSPGEVVIPRSIADDPEKAKEFVAHIKNQKRSKNGGFGRVIEAHRKLGETLKALKGEK